MPIFEPGPFLGAQNTGYQISRSLRFRSFASAFLSRTPASAGNRKTWTWSGWLKLGSITANGYSIFGGGTPASNWGGIEFDGTNGVISVRDYNGSSNDYQILGTPYYRDYSAWYHLVVKFDDTQATSANRLIIYINGSAIAVSGTYPAQNTDYRVNSAAEHRIMRYMGGAANYMDGYLAEVNFIDTPIMVGSTNSTTTITLTSGTTSGLQVGWNVGGTNIPAGATISSITDSTHFVISSAATGTGSSISFGATPPVTAFGAYDATTGVWGPARYTGTYGTNGFYLPFSDNTTTLGGNLCIYSEDISNAAYTKDRSTVSANSTTAPNGTTTADSLIEDTSASNTHRYYSGIGSPTNGVTYTWSVYAKANTRSAIALEAWNGSTAKYAYADLSAGTIISGSDASAAITSVGSGWYRVSVQHTGVGSAGSTGIYLMNAATAGAMTYTGNGSGSVYIWGNQVEQASSVGPYYSTGASSIASTYRIAKDTSVTTGGYNNWVTNNISLSSGTTYDSMIDSPTNYADGDNGRGNYCVLNPLASLGGGTISLGNLNFAVPAVDDKACLSTFAVNNTTSKWYCEVTLLSPAGVSDYQVGVFSSSTASYSTAPMAAIFNTTIQVNGAQVATGTPSLSGGDIVGVAYDGSAGAITFYKNNTLVGTYTISGANNRTLYFGARSNGSGIITQYAFNFGQRPFTYTPPSGFLALNTQNLPTPTIANGANYMAATTYTGTAAPLSVSNGVNSGNNPLGITFQPDFCWFKTRTTTGSPPNGSHQTYNSTTPYEVLYTDVTSAGFNPGTAWFTFANNGVSLTSSTQLNNSTTPFILWQWNAGTGTSTVPTGGTITPTAASINVSAGFSIISYTGTGSNATVPHGLGATPAFIMIKDRTSGTNGGVVYHTSLGATQYLQLFVTTNGNVNATTDNTMFNGSSPTFNSSVFSVGTNVRTNTTDNYIAYIWTPISGYSSFGSYAGVTSTDGPFIFCNFRPRFVMYKNTTTTSTGWVIFDTTRDLYNVEGQYLQPNTSGAEGTSATLDILSNGFKFRATSTDTNLAGNTYIYMAFAENPFRIARAR